MYKLLLPLFLVRLSLSVSPFLLKFAFSALYPFRVVMGTTVFFGFYLMYIISSLFNPTQVASPQVSMPNPSAFHNKLQETGKTTSFESTEENLEQHRQELLGLLERQPTHRDVLFNLYLLETAAGNTLLAESYLEKAAFVDPNHPLVKAAKQNSQPK
jgi:hypothetical protein